MKENDQIQTCSRCGATLAPNALKGLCPRCLLALNLATQTEVAGEEAGPNGTQVVKPPPPPAPSPEEIAGIFPQFEILECLGRGGMGVVYKARQRQLDRFVALKVLLPERQAGGQFAERFAREARALARLNHPDIVAVHDFGEARGYPYLVMEYVDGLSLRQLLQRGKLAPEEALAIVPKICEALQFAHQQGIVHRDIKPENILMDKAGRVKIADFGIAKILAPGVQDVSLTGGKDVVGTPHYMAPEQVEHPTKVDHRADIFSLGVVFYEMLTGELPLGKFQPPSHKVQVDVRLDEVVLHALEKEPERRYQQVSEVRTAVETIAGSAQPVSPSNNAPRGPDWRARIAVVGVRDGKRVVNWPGVALSSVLMVGCSLTGVLITYLISGRAQWSLIVPIMGVLVVGTMVLGIAWGWRRSLDRLISLDDPPDLGSSSSPTGAGARENLRLERWTARILGTLWALVLLVFLVAQGAPPIPNQPVAGQIEFAALALMLAGCVAGWWRDGLAALLTLGGWALFHAAEGHVPAWSLFHGSAVVGVLFGISWAQRRLAWSAGIVAFPVLFALLLNLTFSRPAPAPPAKMSGPAGPAVMGSFGPIMERVVKFEDSFLDLDTGEFVDYKGDATDSRQVGAAGADLYFHPIQSNLNQLTAVNMLILPLSASGWEKSAQEINQLIGSFRDRSQALRSYAFIGPNGAYAFRTFKGNVGVLEFLGSAIESNGTRVGVKIRYKLVQKAVAPKDSADFLRSVTNITDQDTNVTSLRVHGRIVTGQWDADFQFVYQRPDRASLLLLDHADQTPLHWATTGGRWILYDPRRGKILNLETPGGGPTFRLSLNGDDLEFEFGQGKGKPPRFVLALADFVRKTSHQKLEPTGNGTVMFAGLTPKGHQVRAWAKPGEDHSLQRLELEGPSGTGIFLDRIAVNTPLPSQAFALPAPGVLNSRVELESPQIIPAELPRWLASWMDALRTRQAIRHPSQRAAMEAGTRRDLDWPALEKSDAAVSAVLRDALTTLDVLSAE